MTLITMSTKKIISLMNKEDETVIKTINQELDTIKKCIEVIKNNR